MIYRNVRFEGIDVHLDGHTFIECHFESCHVVYSGGPLPVMEGGSVVRCQWDLAGAAARTMQFIANLYLTDQKLAEGYFDMVRNMAAKQKGAGDA